MSKNAYSDLKAAWHLKDIETLRSGVQIVPHQVQLIISDLCNHDCHFCAYRMSGGFSSEQFPDENGNHNPNRMIPHNKCLEILDDCARLGVKAIQFTGGGEPTVHPAHIAVFDHAQQLGLETSLVTNGYLLKDGWEEVFPRMTWIRVSIDAGNPESYRRVRQIRSDKAFERTLANLESIVAACDRDKTLIGAGYVVTNENYKDILEGLRWIRETGVHYVRLCAMFSSEGASYYNGTYPAIKNKIIAARETLETESFRIVDLFGDRISDLEQGAPDYEFCGYQQFNTYIGANLKVYRCCTTAYTRRGEIGDLSEQRFREWFYSEEKQVNYAVFNARGCHTCQFNGKNRAINYMIDPQPMHVEFV